MGSNTPGRKINAAEKTFDIIELVQQLNGATVTEVAEEMGMANSTIHDYFSTLSEKKYLVKRDDEYHLGLKFLDHGSYVRDNFVITEVARPVIDNLADRTSMNVRLWIEEYGAVVAILQSAGESGVQATNWIGKFLPMHACAPGKAMFAFFEETKQQEILDDTELKRFTDNTITDRQQLQERLEEIHEQRYAFSKGETVEGIRAVSSPVVVDGDALGAISVSGPRYRLTGEYFDDELPRLLLEATSEIQINLEEHDPADYSIQ